MTMESSRKHSFDKSRELGLKRPRLADESSLSSRPFQQQRPVNSGSVTSATSLRSRSIDRESDESVRGPYQPPPPPPPNQLRQLRELVAQYKAALSELTFNSKPVITNLTIIASENSHAAKHIAGIVCTNILEVPTEQKLPSLYLLDSIVKNVGRDYIKHFAARLPEIFCNAYRRVDRSVQPGMRHLFGTWKGVFPPQTLQIIERELGFAASVNGSSSGSTTSMVESQSRRQPHSMHVNPKYLEARLQQSSRPNEVVSNISGTSVTSTEYMERPSQIVRVGSEKPWRDSSIKLHNFQHPRIKESRDSGLDKFIGLESEDYEYDSRLSRHLTSRVGKVNDKIRDKAYDKRWFSVDRGFEESVSSQRDGYIARQNIQSYTPSRLASVHLPPTKNIGRKSTGEMSRSWKNSEEEEYTWDDLNHGVSNYVPADSKKDHWDGEDLEKMEFAGHLTRQSQIEVGLGSDREIDSLSSEKVYLGHQRSSWLSREQLPLHGSDNSLPRTSFKSDVVPAQPGIASFGLPTGSVSGSSGSVEKRHPSSGKLLISQRSSLSSSSMQDTRLSLSKKDYMLVNSVAQPNHKAPPFSGLSDTGPQNLKFQESLPGLHEDLHLDNTNKSDLQTSFQSRQHNPLVRRPTLDHPEVESFSQFQKPVPQKGSPSGTLETIVRESAGQLSTSSLLAAIMKTGILSGSLTADVKPPLLPKFSQPLLSDPVLGSSSSLRSLNDTLSLLSQGNKEKPSNLPYPESSSSSGCSITSDATISGSNSFTSLLNTLVAKGLISASKNESSTSFPSLSQNTSNQMPTVATTTSFEVPKVPVSSTILSSSCDSLASSEPAPCLNDVEPQAQETEIECLLGFEFKADILRQFHSTVIDRLFNGFLYSCSICGLRLKLRKRLDRHLEWHVSKQLKPDNSKMPSRRWFSKSADWVAGKTELTFEFSQSGSLEEQSKALEKDSEPMVPADESYCVCLLCGELFEDVYSQEMDQWMFKGAVYMTIPSEKGGKESTTSWSTRPGIIVHAICMSDTPVHDIGLASNDKLEIDV